MPRTGPIFSRGVTELQVVSGFAALALGDVRRAARDARSLARLRVHWTQNAAVMLRAGLARRAGNLERAVELVTQARESEETRGGALLAKALSRRVGEWTGGSEGRAAVDAADGWMTARGIADPGRMTQMLFGGL
jgi:hypothetical protein